MNVLEQMERDLALVMAERHGDSIAVAVVPEGGGRVLSVRGKFDEAYAAVDPGSQAPVSSAAPTVFLQKGVINAALGRNLTKRDLLRINGRVFKPEEFQPDGLGLLTIRLQEL